MLEYVSAIFLSFKKQADLSTVREIVSRHFSALHWKGQEASFQLEMVSAEWRKIYSLLGFTRSFQKI